VDFNPRLEIERNLFEFRRNGACKNGLYVPFLRNSEKGRYLHPWIEIHGYNIDRAYGTFVFNRTSGIYPPKWHNQLIFNDLRPSADKSTATKCYKTL
jgi:hypothetical protein